MEDGDEREEHEPPSEQREPEDCEHSSPDWQSISIGFRSITYGVTRIRSVVIHHCWGAINVAVDYKKSNSNIKSINEDRLGFITDFKNLLANIQLSLIYHEGPTTNHSAFRVRDLAGRALVGPPGCRHQLLGDPKACPAVAIGVCNPAHLRIGAGIVEQYRHLGKEPLLVGAHQLGKTQFHGFRTLGGFSGNQYRFSKRWRLFLDAPGIGDHKMAALQQKDELGIIDRIGEEHIGVIAKGLDRLSNIWVSMDRKNNRGIGSVGDAGHRAGDAGDPAIEAGTQG